MLTDSSSSSFQANSLGLSDLETAGVPGLECAVALCRGSGTAIVKPSALSDLPIRLDVRRSGASLSTLSVLSTVLSSSEGQQSDGPSAKSFEQHGSAGRESFGRPRETEQTEAAASGRAKATATIDKMHRPHRLDM